MTRVTDCAFLFLLLIAMISPVMSSRQHPRHVHLRGHTSINTEAQPSWDGETISSSKGQFIVHIRGPVHHNDVSRLEKDLGVTFDAYLPHNSFLLYARRSVAMAARRHPLVMWVGSFLPEYKTSMHLFEALRALPHGPVSLDVTTVRLTSSEYASTISELSKALPAATITSTADNAFLVTVANAAAKAAIEVLAANAAVHAIDLSAKATSPELHATIVQEVVEFGDNGITPVSESGLDGSSQVIGCGDSGLATSSCFFVDPLHPITTSTLVYQSSEHRKIVLYNATFGDFTDGTAHGTPVAGAALGKYFIQQDELNNYQGVAPNATIAFLDLQTGSNSSLNIPADLASSYFGPLVAAGAKVILSPWGSYNSRRLYTVQEQAVDAYLAANPTVIAIFSAGNDGAKGAYSISSPASSKNAIAVGASQTSTAGSVDALDVSAITALYNSYVSRLCPSSGASTDELYNDLDFCVGVGITPASTPNVPCQYGQTDFCAVLTTSGCCAYRSVGLFSACCVDAFTDAIQQAPASFGINNVASFSSRGPAFDGRIKPDITAPGESVKTAAVQASCPGTLDAAGRAAAVAVTAGTSIAAGNLAGAITLMRQYFTEGYYPTGAPVDADSFEPSSALIKALLVAGAQPLSGISGSFKGLGAATWGDTRRYDNNQGFGRVQLATSLYLNTSTYVSTFKTFIEEGSLSTNGLWSKCVSFAVATTTPLSIAIAWTDPAAATSAGIALVNNLDLSVSYQTASSNQYTGATVVYPNGLGQPDILNNVEHIQVNPNGQSNIWIRVYGANVPRGPQSFSIVITGDFVESCSTPYLCPRSCSGAGICDTTTGECTCTNDQVSGPDCTAALTCGTLGNCSGNGVCNSAGSCVCASGFEGTDCETNLLGIQSGSSSTGGSVTKRSGISTGVFVGVVIALFIFGCILALFIGVFGGLKYAEWRRQKTKKKANRMLSSSGSL